MGGGVLRGCIVNINIPQLSRELAYNAHRGSSFNPEDRADREVMEFRDILESYVASFSNLETDENSQQLTADVQRFIDGYHKRKVALLSAMTRHVSSFIAGPSNYPVARMEKRMAVIDDRTREFLDYCETVPAKIKRRYSGKAAIDSGDPNAIEALEAKLAKLQTFQDVMKEANKIIRSKKTSDTEKVALLCELDGISEATAQQLLCDEYPGRGFPRFELTNNGANIRRLVKRIAAIKQQQAAAAVEYDGDDFQVFEDAEDNRIRIVFPGKPADAIRAWLKSRGWNWSGYHNAWQRKITPQARKCAMGFIDTFRG